MRQNNRSSPGGADPIGSPLRGCAVMGAPAFQGFRKAFTPGYTRSPLRGGKNASTNTPTCVDTDGRETGPQRELTRLNGFRDRSTDSSASIRKARHYRLPVGARLAVIRAGQFA